MLDASSGRPAAPVRHNDRRRARGARHPGIAFATLRPAEASADLRDLHAAAYSITAAPEIEQGDMLVDSLHAPGALRVGPDVKAPVLVHRVEPVYTDEARRARVAGVVIVEAVVGKTGAVKDAMVLKPLPFGLSEAGLAAVQRWKFRPATLHGEPVDVIFNVTVSFHLAS